MAETSRAASPVPRVRVAVILSMSLPMGCQRGSRQMVTWSAAGPTTEPSPSLLCGGSVPGEDREHARIAVVLDLVDAIEQLDVVVGELEVDVGIGPHVVGVRGLGQREQSELEQVADGQPRDGDAVPVGEPGDLL